MRKCHGDYTEFLKTTESHHTHILFIICGVVILELVPDFWQCGREYHVGCLRESGMDNLNVSVATCFFPSIYCVNEVVGAFKEEQLS